MVFIWYAIMILIGFAVWIISIKLINSEGHLGKGVLFFFAAVIGIWWPIHQLEEILPLIW